jgi:phenylalanyl-tRNA synthetase alpha chain
VTNVVSKQNRGSVKCIKFVTLKKSMINTLKEHIAEVEKFSADTKEAIETFRIKYLGKKGLLNDFFAEFKNVPNAQKKEFGQTINELKQTATDKVNELKNALETTSEEKGNYGDLTRPGNPIELGARHPISIVKNQIIEIFSRIGFNVSEGPEIEDDWHNFTALNLPEYHPARDMQDTFFVQTDPDILLRTHTSSVQVRYMENNKPPIRTISPGRVYRNEAISARSHCFFHQVEGLYIDKDVSFADLKQTLQYFTTELFGKSKIRLRPSYFPFTEPSAEVDVYWGLETETDYKMTKGTGWLEIMGCGMVDPNVLKNCGIDSEEYSGFAFGMGIDRIALLLHQISDIRLLSENDIRFLEQFKSAL